MNARLVKETVDARPYLQDIGDLLQLLEPGAIELRDDMGRQFFAPHDEDGLLGNRTESISRLTTRAHCQNIRTMAMKGTRSRKTGPSYGKGFTR